MLTLDATGSSELVGRADRPGDARRSVARWPTRARTRPWASTSARSDRRPMGPLRPRPTPEPTSAPSLDSPTATPDRVRPTPDPTPAPAPTSVADAGAEADRRRRPSRRRIRPPKPTRKPAPNPLPFARPGPPVVRRRRRHRLERLPRTPVRPLPRRSGIRARPIPRPSRPRPARSPSTEHDLTRPVADERLRRRRRCGTTYYYRTMAFDGADRMHRGEPGRSGRPEAGARAGHPRCRPGRWPEDQSSAGPRTRDRPTASPGTGWRCRRSTRRRACSRERRRSSTSGEQGLSEAVAELPGGTYHFRLQVLRSTEAGSPARFLVAQTDVATYVVP